MRWHRGALVLGSDLSLAGKWARAPRGVVDRDSTGGSNEPIPSTKGLDAGDRRQLVINFANTWDLGKGAFTRPTFVFVNDDA